MSNKAKHITFWLNMVYHTLNERHGLLSDQMPLNPDNRINAFIP